MTHLPKILLLGGTADAMQMAAALAGARIDAVYSVAGRTESPSLPALPHRSGGFGGVAGLAAYLRGEGITHVIDATHPFAAQMSDHAVQACGALGLPLIALEREAWVPGPGDNWQFFKDIPAIAAALPDAPIRVFLAIGRQHLEDFAGKSQHDYLLRLVDAPQGPLPLPKTRVVVSKGPFTTAGDVELMRAHGCDLVVAKNAGGAAARAKLDAARDLGLPVWLAERPVIAQRRAVGSVAEVMAWLADHSARLGV